MQFAYLKDHQEFIPIIATWFYKEWQHLNPTRTLDDVITMIYSQLNKNKPPTIFIGLDDNNHLLGTIILRVSEMENFEQLSPWLSSLYVPVEKRHQGVGCFLVNELTKKAKSLGYPFLYLFTEDHEAWYEKMNWVTFEKVIHRGYSAAVMRIALGD